MPTGSSQTPLDLARFSTFLDLLQREGVIFTVIGGCAVEAYARAIQEKMSTVDLDILVDEATLRDVLRWAPSAGIRVVKRPQPRNVPVAFLDVDGKEVNVLTSSRGLPEADQVARLARVFELRGHDGLEVPIADPYDLLANKLAVRRDKDQPHIEILVRFIELEILETFASDTHARARLAPAKRYLTILGLDELPDKLGEKLLERAREDVDFRFLAGRLPPSLFDRLLARVGEASPLRRQIEAILESRRGA